MYETYTFITNILRYSQFVIINIYDSPMKLLIDS